MKKTILYIFIGFHFFSIVYNNIIIEEQTILHYFYQKKDAGLAARLMDKTGFFSTIFDFYSIYTGTEAGYGFYAPNVSSQSMVLFTIKDDQGEIVGVQMPNQFSKEGVTRCMTAFDKFIDKFDDPSKLYDRYLDVILKSMALKVLEQNPPHQRVEADIYLYLLPRIRAFRDGESPVYESTFHYSFELCDPSENI